MKKEKGITLVALVITIIILLILAGVTISQLIENGLFEKAKQAKEEYAINQSKEKLNLKIMEFRALSTDNEVLEQFRDYLAEDISNNLYVVEEVYENNDSNNTIKSLNITDVESSYTFSVDSEFNISGPIESNYKTEATYEITSNDGTKYNILISIKNLSGLQRITCPNGRIIEGNNKINISIDYEIENNNQYEFIIQTKDNKEIFILDTNEINNITISETTSYAYPIITRDGVEIGKNINIEYPENQSKYYSFDDGNTWIEYPDDGIKFTKEGIIKAKTIQDNRITQIVSENITLELATDAITSEAYDGNHETNMIIHYGYNNCITGTNYKYMLVDESAYGVELRIKWYCWNFEGYISYIDFLNKNGESLKQISVSGGNTVDEICVIPEGTIKLKYTMKTSTGGYPINGRIYTIDVRKEPMLEIDEVKYPVLTKEKVQISTNVTIRYCQTSRKRLWKIDDEEWKEYEGYTTKINVELGKTIYVKEIDRYGNETETLSYTAAFDLATDAITSEAYDGDDETNMIIHYGYNDCITGTNYKYMLVDESAYGVELRIKWYCWNFEGYISYIDFLNKNGESLKQISVSGGNTVDESYIIPEGTVKLKYTMKTSTGGYPINGRIYEINIKK